VPQDTRNIYGWPLEGQSSEMYSSDEKGNPSRSGFGPIELITVARLHNLLSLTRFRAKTADSAAVLSDLQKGKSNSVKKIKKSIKLA
jgi:hypothetical protein